jgi:hypothetical protein
MMMLRFRQQNCVDGDGSWWQFLWPFFVVLIHPFYRDFMQDWYKTRDFSAKIS